MGNMVQLVVSSRRRAFRRAMPDDDIGGVVDEAGALGSARAQCEIPHLAFHAAGHDAAATRADALRAQLGEDGLPRLALPPHGPRGEWPPLAEASGG